MSSIYKCNACDKTFEEGGGQMFCPRFTIHYDLCEDCVIKINDFLWRESKKNTLVEVADEEAEKRIGEALKDIEEGRFTEIKSKKEIEEHFR